MSYQLLSLFLSHGMTSPTIPHSRQGFSAGERTVQFTSKESLTTSRQAVTRPQQHIMINCKCLSTSEALINDMLVEEEYAVSVQDRVTS
jgi:hypothetical protein